MIKHANDAATLKEFLESEDDYRTSSRVKSELLRLLERNRDTPYQTFTWMWDYITMGGTQLLCCDKYANKVTIKLRNHSVTLDHEGKVWLHPSVRDSIQTTWNESLQESLKLDDSDFKQNTKFTKELMELMMLYINQNTAVLVPQVDMMYHLNASVTDVEWFKSLLNKVDTLVKQYPYGLLYRHGQVTANLASLVSMCGTASAEYVFTDGLIGWVITVENHVIKFRDLARSDEITSLVLLRQKDVIDRVLDACIIN